jgi:hypothetical protein
VSWIVKLWRWLTLPACERCGCHKPGMGGLIIERPYVCWDCLGGRPVTRPEPQTWYGDL